MECCGQGWVARLGREREMFGGRDVGDRDRCAVRPLEVRGEDHRIDESARAHGVRLGEIGRRVPGAVEFEQRAVQQVADIDDRRIGCSDEWVQRHRALAHHKALGELRAADQPEMQRERKPKSANPEQPERRPGDNLNRPVPTEPPYLVT